SVARRDLFAQQIQEKCRDDQQNRKWRGNERGDWMIDRPQLRVSGKKWKKTDAHQGKSRINRGDAGTRPATKGRQPESHQRKRKRRRRDAVKHRAVQLIWE